MKALIKKFSLLLFSIAVLSLPLSLLSQSDSGRGDSKSKSINNLENKQKLQKELQKRPIPQKTYIKKMLKRAEDHYFKKRYNVALKLFQVIIQKDPENQLAYRYAGDIFLIQKKLKEAKEHFELARELSPHPHEEWFRIAQVHILSEESEQARKSLRKALELKPDMYLCHFYLGLVYYNLLADKANTIKHWEIYREHVTGEEKRKIERALEILRRKNFRFPSKNDPYEDHFSPIN